MNNKFDELTRSLAQSVTRRGAFKKFAAGLVAAVATSIGIGEMSAQGVGEKRGYCIVVLGFTGVCIDPTTCERFQSADCKGRVHERAIQKVCGFLDVDTKKLCG